MPARGCKTTRCGQAPQRKEREEAHRHRPRADPGGDRPELGTADVDVENKHHPRRVIPSRIEAFKTRDREGMEHRDIMQDLKAELETEDEKNEKDER